MATTRIKDKLSKLVPSQLPEFVRSDYSTFVAFLEAYYEFLEQDQNAQEVIQNARSYSDIDLTVDSFVEYFLRQYGNDVPRSVLFNKKALIKNLQDLYESKGSEKSYKLLFRLLYNKEVDIFYPSSQVLIASDGKWSQTTSIYLQTLSGDPSLIENKKVILSSSTYQYVLEILTKKNVSTNTGVSNTVFEFNFNNLSNIPINVGDIIEYPGYKGKIVLIPTSVRIVQPGSGFRLGDILPITGDQGTGARLKVTKINSTGGVERVRFISFGINYPESFYNFFASSLAPVTTTTFTYTGSNVAITDRMTGFIDEGTVIRREYSVDYFSQDYEGVLLTSFKTSTTTSGVALNRPIGTVSSSTGTANDLAVYITSGAKGVYPGYFVNNDGFLSDEIFIQNENYYQPFVYVLKIDELLDKYKKVVQDILHPAGMRLVGDYIMTDNFDATAEITTTLSFLLVRFFEILSIIETNSKSITKPFTETITSGDSTTVDVTKILADSSSTDDSVSNHPQKTIDDSLVIVDSIDSISIAQELSDSINAIESLSFDFTFINNTSNSVNVTESGSVTLEDYALSGYFAEIYAGTVTTF